MSARLWAKVALCLALAGAGCAQRAPASIRVVDAIARVAPGGRMGAVYMKITMGTSEGDRLVAVESAFAQGIEMHETIQSGDVASMVARPEGFEISSGETLELRPGGKHLMMFGVTERAGGSLPLVLRFARAGTLNVEARVVGFASMP